MCVLAHITCFSQYVCWRTDLCLPELLLIIGARQMQSFIGLTGVAGLHTMSLLNNSNNDGPGVNRLLDTLPKNEYQRLLPKLKTVSLVLGDVLYEPGDVIKYVYFPNDSIISLIS